MSCCAVSGRTVLGRLLCSPVATRRSPRCLSSFATLRQQQLELAQQLSRVLAEADQGTTAAQVQQLVTRGVCFLRESQDWQQLATAIEICAEQYNQAACGPAVGHVTVQGTDCRTSGGSRGGPSAMAIRQFGKETRQPQQAASVNAPPPSNLETEGASSFGATSSSSSSSPWGFAMRQPRAAPRPAPPAPSITTMDSTSDAQQQQQQQQQQQRLQPNAKQWDWSSVEHFVVLGLGSLGHYMGTKAPLTLLSSRLGFRLFQLVLAVALWKHMLPGLAHKPTVYDPEFDNFDHQLLTSLGFQVLDKEPLHSVAGRTLMYMPCCPRQLYSQVLAANWNPEQLHQLAIFGTSMRSLADTHALFDSLTAEGPTRPQTAAGSQAPSPPELVLGSAGQSANGTPAAAAAATGVVSMQERGVDFVCLAYRQGVVVEAMAPDCAAHGVAVAVHLFKLRQTSR